MINKEVTITDIAKRLGVSYATVSRALANHPRISENTRKKVTELAGSMGYRPNKYARNLRNQKTHTIGVIVPRLNSLFMSSVIAGMEDIAQQNGYSLLISQSSELNTIEQQNVTTMYNSRVDGLLVSVAYETQDTGHFEIFFKKNVPVIFFDRCVGEEELLSVTIDNKKAGYEATKHLIDCGRRNILHITANSQVNVYKDRLAGYKLALADHNLPFDERNVLYTDLSFASGESTAQNILAMQHRPDGVFVANDNCAAGCIIALKRAGIKIPGDIGFVGFNNDLISRVIEPQLSTINYPGYQIGATATQHLISQLQGPEIPISVKQIILDSELIVRASSGA